MLIGLTCHQGCGNYRRKVNDCNYNEQQAKGAEPSPLYIQYVGNKRELMWIVHYEWYGICVTITITTTKNSVMITANYNYQLPLPQECLQPYACIILYILAWNQERQEILCSFDKFLPGWKSRWPVLYWYWKLDDGRGNGNGIEKHPGYAMTYKSIKLICTSSNIKPALLLCFEFIFWLISPRGTGLCRD